MADSAQVEILKRGAEAWDRWRAENPDIRPDLSGAVLCGGEFSWANLRKADLTLAHLSRADLSTASVGWANLTGANLSWANLSGADLNGAHLSEADLHGANLSGIDLSGADLYSANFSDAVLDEADLSGAVLGWTTLGGLDLSTCRGLETVVHSGPSTIGINTIYRSKGKIPESFLRRAGVPDPFIVHMKALVKAMEPIQFYSCFISYSTKDHELADRLYADLQGEGVRCWFAPEDLKIGDEFRQRIDDAIRVYDKLLIVLSEHSVASEWVEEEVESAVEKERQRKGDVLFPIRVDNAVMKTDQAWAASMRRRRQIGDFTNWEDHDAYKKAFERLLRDLKADNTRTDPSEAE